MYTRTFAPFALIVVLSVAAFACNDTSRCVSGTAVPCSCSGGLAGKQVCLESGEYGPCLACYRPLDGGPLHQGDGSGPRDGSRHDSPASPRDLRSDTPSSLGPTLLDSADPIIEAFPTPAGIIVVSTQSIKLLDRQGQVLETIAAPRELTTASMNDSYLAVGDKAMVTVYTHGLQQERQFPVTQTCVASVIVAANRFVCGPANDWDRIYDTYDLSSGTLLASSSKYTYNGLPMRRLPGTDYFITVSGGSPSDFNLYEVSASGASTFIGESPYHGAFAVSMIFAFDASAVHLISQEGLMLKVVGSNCSNSFTSDCFVKDGVLGTLKTNESFVAMADDGQGILHGLVASGGWGFDCKGGCELQRVDVAQHLVTTRRTHYLDFKRAVATHYDEQSGKVLLAYEGTSGHHVALLGQ